MKIITQRDKIRGVYQAWWNAYGRTASPKSKPGEITKTLSKLDLDTCSAEDIKAVIGSDSWTKMLCDECSLSVDWLIELGEDAPEYMGEPHYLLCRHCAKRAAEFATKL